MRSLIQVTPTSKARVAQKQNPSWPAAAASGAPSVSWRAPMADSAALGGRWCCHSIHLDSPWLPGLPFMFGLLVAIISTPFLGTAQLAAIHQTQLPAHPIGGLVQWTITWSIWGRVRPSYALPRIIDMNNLLLESLRSNSHIPTSNQIKPTHLWTKTCKPDHYTGLEMGLWLVWFMDDLQIPNLAIVNPVDINNPETLQSNYLDSYLAKIRFLRKANHGHSSYVDHLHPHKSDSNHPHNSWVDGTSSIGNSV